MGAKPPPELFKKVRDLGVLGQQAVLLYLGQVYREIEAADRSLQRKNGERPRGNDGKEHPESSADAYSFRTGVKRAVHQFLYEDNLENYQKKTNMDYGGKNANGLHQQKYRAREYCRGVTRQVEFAARTSASYPTRTVGKGAA